MLLEDFKKTVDTFTATIRNDNLLDACNQLGIDTSRGYSGRQVTSKLYENIKEALTIDTKETPEKISRTQLLKLQSELVYRLVIYKEEAEQYLIILKIINDSCRPDVNYFPLFSETSKWEKAIVNCKNYKTFAPNTHAILFGDIRKDYPKDFDIALSTKQLIDKGCQIEIKNSNIHIKSGLEAVVNELNEKVKCFGGITLVKSIFYFLKLNKLYSPRFERYFFPRTTSGISYDQKPQVPFGYLLNLSLKFPYENSLSENHQPLLKEIIDLSITITNAAYGVQHYNYWEYYFQSGETIIQFCTEIALWDSIFSLPQCRPSSALEITDKLFSFIDNNKFKDTLGFTKEQLLLVSNEIHKITTELKEPTIIYYSTLCKKIKSIEKITIQTILDFLSHHNPVNENYVLPSDYSSIDFFKKPLIKLGNTKFLLMDKSWCSPNYFEAVASELRTAIPDLDSKIGNELELFLQNKLIEKGITFSSGEYSVDGIDGECDLIIESEKVIILVEFKKKVLTRKSKSGIDINILLDLSESILSAQLQAGRTELFLRTKGNLSLKDKNGKTTIVNLNNREIERIALTQIEFGGFQDRTIIKQFLKTLLTHSFGTYSNDKTIIKKYAKLAEQQNLWLEQYNKFYEMDNNYHRYAYFNCWFMSLPQLMEVINLSTDNNSFTETLRKNKHVTLNTLDWYREFELATQLQYEAK